MSKEKANRLDRLIGWISPKAGASRLAWRNNMEQQRSNYDAADTGRLQSQWTLFNETAEQTDSFERDIVRARARDLERNSDIENGITRAFRRNVIGTGLHVRITTGDSELDQQLEKHWKRWCKARNCDVTGMQSLSQMLRMCVQRKVVDGGFIILKRYTNQGFLPLQLQVMEVDDLDTAQMKPHAKGNRVVGGIEYNAWNRPQGYWIRQVSVDGLVQLPSIFIEAKDAIFYFTKRRPTQIREFSDVAPVVTRIKNTNEFMHAVAVKERINSCLAAFIMRMNPASGTYGRIAGTEDGISYQGRRLVPGMIMELNPGDSVQCLNPSGQATDAASFVKLQQRMISAGSGLSYEATSRDLSETTYSSARQGLIEDDLTYGEEREGLQEIVLDEIYESFVISCWLKGFIGVPGFWENKERYLQHEWVTEPRRWIDPQKEANANRIALATGQKTFQQICSENGRDWKQVIDEMAEAYSYASEKGIELSKIVYGQDSIELYGDEQTENQAKKGDDSEQA